MNRREFLMSSACACLATATANINPLLCPGRFRRGSDLAGTSLRHAAPHPCGEDSGEPRHHRAPHPSHEFPWHDDGADPLPHHPGWNGRQADRSAAEGAGRHAEHDLQALRRPVQNHRRRGSSRTPRGSGMNIGTEPRDRDEDRSRQGHRALPQHLHLRARRRVARLTRPSRGGSPRRRSSTAWFCTTRASRIRRRPGSSNLGRSISA